jgi:Trypsin-like peptidase domain
MRCFISSAISSLTLLTLLSPPRAQAQQPQRNVSQVVKATIDSVVLIVVSDESGKPVSLGSGFIVSSDGKIVTNHHVIAGAHSAVVKLNTGAFYPVAGILADDSDRDIAVIKVSGKNLPILVLADSDALSVGDHVVAIGSPIGLENSVSDGIISGFREDSKRTWIQTTAPASHGNSGGPLLTMDEKVAGIVTWKKTEGENLNFAVPSKSIAALLTSSTVRPFESASNADSTPSTPSAPPAEERVWTSTTSRTDYKVRTDGNYIYTQWINLPSDLQARGVSKKAELKKTGDKWVGKETINFPWWGKCNPMEADIEIVKLSETRIEGKILEWSYVDPRKCQPNDAHIKSFTWIPK